MNENVFVEYAPILIVVVAFLFKNKFFVTPEQMQLERKGLMKEVEEKFLSLLAFHEYEKRMDDNFLNIKDKFEDTSNRFDKVDESLEHIKDLLIKKDL